VEHVLRIALEKHSEDRFASAEELSNAFLAAVTLAPVASPFARPFGMPAPLFPSSSTRANPSTPPINSQEGSHDPVTPLPPSLALSSLTSSAPVSETASSQFSDDVALLQEPVAPSPAGKATGSDVTELRRKNFLLEQDGEKDPGMFWLADPQEWSPLANSFSADEFNKMPLSAGDYLQSKPLLSHLPLTTPAPGDLLRAQKRIHKSLLQRWLPVVVVALLLLGLLVSLLSALLFPT
jgi:hypothetical protein